MVVVRKHKRRLNGGVVDVVKHNRSVSDGKVKRSSVMDEISDLVSKSDDLTTSDLQGASDAIANRFGLDRDEVWGQVLDRVEKKNRVESVVVDKEVSNLEPRYDSSASFYGKAKVERGGGVVTLFSYNTRVAEIKNGVPVVFDTYSTTTLRHIKEFLLQHGFKADSKSQILRDYGV